MIFRDIDQLRGGKKFPDELSRALKNSRVMLVVIGPRWLTAEAADGKRRLDDPDDLVRKEVAQGLNNGLTVIPVLVGDATMPLASSLPEEIRPISFIHAQTVPSGQGFGTGMQMLVQQIGEATGARFENYFGALRDCQQTGLVTVKSNFRSDSTVLAEMEETRNLIVVMNDGRGWLDQNKEIVLNRLRDPKKFTSVVLLHPKSDFLDVLIKKNGKSIEQQRSDIEHTYRTLRTTARSTRRLEIRGHHGFNGYSLTMGDSYAFISPYLFNEAGALPLMKFSSLSSQGIYHQIKADAVQLITKSPELTATSFLPADGGNLESTT